MANSVFRSDLKTWVHHKCVRYKDIELVLGAGAQGGTTIEKASVKNNRTQRSNSRPQMSKVQ
jgi:hypothetical protein